MGRTLLITVAVLAILAGAALVGLGYRDGTADDQPIADGDTTAGATTAVFSARRSPELLARPVAARRLGERLAPLLALAPPESCVTVSDSGRRLSDLRSKVPLIPASNQKLAVAAATLDRLGPDTTFTTTAEVATPISAAGVIDGDLHLIGGGDPLLTTAPYLPTIRYGPPPSTPLEALADQIVGAGVREIRGAVVGDETRYDSQRTIPTWPERYITNANVGPLSALSVNDAREYPATGAAASGVLPAADPPGYAAAMLAQLLVERGVVVGGGARSGQAPDSAEPVASVESLPVSELVAELLVFSDNNTAELLVKELGVAEGGAGSTEAGLGVVSASLAADGVTTDGLVLIDGSGLDRGDRLTCDAIIDILEADGVGGALWSGLPVANENGTLRDRYVDSPAAGKVRAKTGSLTGVTALSGWVRTDPGADVAFAILLNSENSSGHRDYSEAVTEAILTYPEQPDLSLLGPSAPA